MLSLGLLIFCGILLFGVLGIGGVLLLLKLGIIVREAQRPAIQDYGSYSLEQGREVRPEEEQARTEGKS